MAILGYQAFPLLVPFDEKAYADRLARLYTPNDLVIPQGSSYVVHPLEAFCIVEHVNAMPGQGVTSCFSFGQNFGFILGLLTAFRIPFELARPQRWKREFGCTSDKNTSIAVAKRLFPDVDLRRTPQCKKPHDGVCEALLMAEYARRLRS